MGQVVSNVFLGGGNSNVFHFHSYLGKRSNLTNIFQMGWFNHQLVFYLYPDPIGKSYFLNFCSILVPSQQTQILHVCISSRSHGNHASSPQKIEMYSILIAVPPKVRGDDFSGFLGIYFSRRKFHGIKWWSTYTALPVPATQLAWRRVVVPMVIGSAYHKRRELLLRTANLLPLIKPKYMVTLHV